MRVLAIAMLAALAGCTVAPAADTPTPAATFAPASHAAFGQPFTAAEATACTAAGGKVSRRGRLGTDYCVTALADAGKVCSDKADCTGKCIGAATAAAGSAVTGTCQPDNGPLFGCYSTVVGGKATAAICVD
jgi:hypothetical protein